MTIPLSIKLIRSLQQRKYRAEQGLFVAEGTRLVEELLSSPLVLEVVYHTELWAMGHGDIMARYDVFWQQVTGKTMERISGQKSPSGVLAIAQIPAPPALSDLPGVTLYLDHISDPGNMGTIIRSAEWFGVQQVLLSPECVDSWSPKVLQASMGSRFRIPVIETELNDALKVFGDPLPVIYAADMQGEDINNIKFADNAVVIVGSEAHGVNKELHAMVHHYITIPRASEAPVPESLNASVAASVICFAFAQNKIN